jgi:hypothetical protein
MTTYKIGSLRLPEFDELKGCRSVLARCLGNRYLSFAIGNSRPDLLRFVLQGVGRSTISADDDTPVFELFTVEEIRFWISVSLCFKAEASKHKFASASILILRGALESDRKEKLLRAEWDSFADTAVHAPHAQPHWHVYGSAMDSLDDEGARTEDLVALKKFHFAMASSWHTGDHDSRVVMHSSKALSNWVGGCLAYTKSQLKYLVSKS